MAIQPINSNVPLIDKDGKATPPMLRWMNAVTTQLNSLPEGFDFTGDLGGQTTTVVNGVITDVV
jgi:hypothetical protein